ncbi:MAG: flagellar motor stator protein MotA [Alphaproteobacteria bacterium]|nr:flagellar motor stator protein MotA [Alphaproteobacteria bacterium]
MAVIGGLIFIFACVFGSYIMSGGKIEIVLEAAPHELMAIGGAAIGALVVANKMNVVKKLGSAFKKALKGPQWKKQDYKDILCLLFLLCKLMKSKGLIAVEQHIEKPEESSLFKQFPSILHDHFSVDLICDTLRSMTMGMENPHQVEDVLEKKIEKHHHEAVKPAGALAGMAEGLPAIGIVAAVLGVIKTMASINKPPEILGQMIGGALVGTFMGVFLSYCVVGPLAGKATQSLDEEQQLYFIIRDVLVAHLKGAAPQISMEVGRGNIPTHYQPTFQEMEEASSTLKVEG